MGTKQKSTRPLVHERGKNEEKRSIFKVVVTFFAKKLDFPHNKLDKAYMYWEIGSKDVSQRVDGFKKKIC